MTRHTAGLAVFVLILLSVLCVPGIIGRSVGGDAAPAVHVDPRPAVGNCLAPLTSPDQLNSVLDVVPIVACSEAHSAEILAVGALDHKIWPKRPTVMDPTFTGGALSSKCDQLAGRFLAWGERTELPRIPVSFFTRLTVPNDLQWQLGQRWWACELMPSLLDYPISYMGTARNASIATPRARSPSARTVRENCEPPATGRTTPSSSRVPTATALMSASARNWWVRSSARRTRRSRASSRSSPVPTAAPSDAGSPPRPVSS